MKEQWYEGEQREDGVWIKKYSGEEAYAEIPGQLMGGTVTGIGPYAFRDKRCIRQLLLPPSMQYIGAHCFYDCRALSYLELYDGIQDMGDGVFKNCGCLREIKLYAPHGFLYGIKGILSELNQEICITICYREGTAKLLFPAYLYDYEENTMARIINQVTYGCGVHYRECVSETWIDCRKYDQLFRFTIDNEKEETAGEIAVLRLWYPYELRDTEKHTYLDYVEGHYMNIMERAMKKGDLERCMFLLQQDFVTEARLEKVLEMGQRAGNVELVSWLLSYKKERFGVQKKSFEL